MMSIQEMRALLGLSRASFSRIYKIPVRTLENWESGVRKCPDYVMYLLDRVVREDASNPDNLLTATTESQIDEMETAETDEEIINNRFL